MKILVTNDDGVRAEGLHALVKELSKVAKVTVIAPESERSAIGTAVTLLKSLHVKEMEPIAPGVATYAVNGMPGDCVILGLGKLVPKVDLVVSGVNPSLNLGEDVYISGTVGAAMQGFFRGLPAMAVSAAHPERDRLSKNGLQTASKSGLQTAAEVAAKLAAKMDGPKPQKIFLNVNVPDIPFPRLNGVRLTRLARSSHINTVEEEGEGALKQYRLVRVRLDSTEEGSDVQAIEQGYVSLTALYTSLLDKPPQKFLNKLCSELERELKAKN
ncbi:MAG TPA: 5'/3'-nucleotidase SurE [Dehalococcoidales bacterium]|nr:5'/3'-nucleotidase SurE [Dehalococcoidales bacterium]